MSQETAASPSQFGLSVDMQADAIVVHCAGRLTGENGNTLRNEAKKFIAPGKRVVIDLTHVTHTDSMGLSAIISLYVSAKSAGCRLELINLGQKIVQLFSIANLLSLFEPLGDGSFRLP
jgi:anti-anti-sigma factor